MDLLQSYLKHITEFNLAPCQCLKYAGLLVLAVHVLKDLLPWIYGNIIGPFLLSPKVNFRKLGKWAIVTGATDGIGKAYAKELAKKGLNIVLISRTLSKLENVAAEIGDETKVEVKIIQADFTQDLKIYEKIQKEIDGLEVGVLVNNIGISYSYPEYFVEQYRKNPKFLQDIVSANIHSVTHMTALVLGGMVDRRKGLIINISSLASVIPNPLLSVYSATKAFVNKFSEDLNTEYKRDGIIIQSVLPGFVATNMSKLKKATWAAPSPATYVKSALRTVGIQGQTTGYVPHALLEVIIKMISRLSCDHFARELVFKQLLTLRKKALYNEAKLLKQKESASN